MKIIFLSIFSFFIMIFPVMSVHSTNYDYSFLFDYTETEHIHCLDDLESPRWTRIHTYKIKGFEDGIFKIDSESVLRHNKFIPFADRKIELWITLCRSYDRVEHSIVTTLYLFNIDNRTYQLLNSNVPKSVFHVKPNSAEEAFMLEAEKLY